MDQSANELSANSGVICDFDSYCSHFSDLHSSRLINGAINVVVAVYCASGAFQHCKLLGKVNGLVNTSAQCSNFKRTLWGFDSLGVFGDYEGVWFCDWSWMFHEKIQVSFTFCN
jgi:hypothetical protein